MKTLVLGSLPDELESAAAFLRKHQTVAIPTETVYGLAANAYLDEAVLRIFEAKERPRFDPLIVHVSQKQIFSAPSCAEALRRQGLLDDSAFIAKAHDFFESLCRKFWPGPLTFVVPKGSRVPDLVTSGLETVGIRMPRHPIAQSLLDLVDFPLAAPSANRFGRISPTSARDVEEELSGRIAVIVDGGAPSIGIESTVIHLEPQGRVTLLRPGAITALEIEAVIGEPLLTRLHAEAPQSPGQLLQHYAPLKPLYRLSRTLAEEQHRLPHNAGVLTFSENSHPRADLKVFDLSRMSAQEVARNLFLTLRKMDHSDSEALFCESYPHSEGIGFAIQDRLQRASRD